jgi:hypothetical protein
MRMIADQVQIMARCHARLIRVRAGETRPEPEAA